MSKKLLKFIYSFIILGTIVSCTPKEQGTNEEEEQEQEVPTSRVEDQYQEGLTSWKILEDTLYETPVYVYKSHTPGPRVAIVGGIHGDEVAGWKCAESLINRTDFKGTVMIIPYANILADIAIQRYLGYGYSGKVSSNPSDGSYKYYQRILNDVRYEGKNLSKLTTDKFYDINRLFPGGSTGSSSNKIANAVFNTVVDFVPHYCVDLHEARRNCSDNEIKSDNTSYLGSCVVYNNGFAGLVAERIVSKYNTTYAADIDGLDNGYTQFQTMNGCYKMNTDYDKRFGKQIAEHLDSKRVRSFTFETNRQVSEATKNKANATDTRDVTKRVTEQTRLVEIMLDIAYEEYCAGKFSKF